MLHPEHPAWHHDTLRWRCAQERPLPNTTAVAASVQTRGIKTGLLLAMFSACLLCCSTRASEPSSPSAAFSPKSAVHEDEEPARLKQQVRITVETNAAPETATNAASAKKKSFHWNLSWQDWGGLHYELSQKTPLTNRLFGFHDNLEVTNSAAGGIEKIEGTEQYRIFHLEELEMSGKSV